mmetsp:Transcript_164804/g.528766  ORF Transcript_164804/g.528766 Transcript_164804/m.528766 type:complete len:289 (-) Transcript_164804:30-896(-)
MSSGARTTRAWRWSRWSATAPPRTSGGPCLRCEWHATVVRRPPWAAASTSPAATMGSRSNRWEFLPPMPSARSRATAVAARGRLFVVGGRDSRATASPVPTLAAVESYDPRLGRWEVLPSLPLAPLGCSASVVQGQIYVVGVNLEREMAVQRLDLQVFCWTSVRAVPRRRFGCAAAALSGTIYVMGGHDGEHPVSCSERFDPLGGGGDGGDGGDGRGEAELWEELTPAPTARHGCAAVAAGGGLYLLGGDDQGSMAAAERYDPELGIWMKLPRLPTGRFGCAAAAAFP